MIQKLKNIILTISAMAVVALPALAPASVYAGTTIQGGFCNGTENLQIDSTGGATCANSSFTEAKANATLTRIINIISAVVGVIAVLMIVFGGFRYITSGGDSTKVGSAKSTILYALIGLVIVAIAQLIVRFVVTNATANS